MKTLAGNSPLSARSTETISDDELWEDEPEMHLARPGEQSPSTGVRKSGARRRKGGKSIFPAQPNPTRRYLSTPTGSSTGDEPPPIDIDRARLRGAVRDGASYALAYLFDVVRTALGLLRKPLAVVLFLYLLSLIFS